MKPPLSIADLDALVFDFDGVLTDDRVWVDQDGREMVCCSRRDGLAFDVLRKTPLKLFILSTETNRVVAARAAKLRVKAVHGSSDKLASLRELAAAEAFRLERTLYVGNDLNDVQAMAASGYSACPSDAHPGIAALAGHRLETAGGGGVVREIVERILGIDVASALKY